MSLVKLALVVALLIGGTAATVVSYVDSRRPVQQDPVVVEQQPPVSPSGAIDLSHPDPDGEELEIKAT